MDSFETHWVRATDGTHLYLRIRGQRCDRPPILYLHGGPGGALNLAAFETCAGPLLEASFPVAYLHQRGVLLSEQCDAHRQYLRYHLQDIREVVRFLCRRFKRKRICLLGHSWGGFTGLAFLVRHERAIARVALICPVVNFPDVQRKLYEMVAQRISADDDPSARRELASIGRPPYPDIDDFIRLQGLGAEAFGDPYQYLVPERLAQYTGYSLAVEHCLAVQTKIAAALWPALYRADLTACLGRLSTPLLMIAGGLDSAIPWKSVKTAFDAYARHRDQADKRWLLLEGSNHLPFTEPTGRELCLAPIVDFMEDTPFH